MKQRICHEFANRLSRFYIHNVHCNETGFLQQFLGYGMISHHQ